MRILVVEDDRIARRIVVETLASQGHEVLEAVDGREGWTQYEQAAPEVVISDWYMPEMDGLELCRRIRAHGSTHYTYFILLTVASGRGKRLEAMAEGVDDFLTKPLDPEELAVRLLVARRIATLHQDVQRATQRLSRLEEEDRTRRGLEGMIGKSPSMQEVYRRVRLSAQSDVTVLLHGESGTGKELAARAIHRLSPRTGAPFLAVNCAALPDTILESELFGHVKGAFTGAHRDKLGLFELAQPGTLFLDEIGDVSLLMQQQLLRVLEQREIRRVGDDRTRPIDVRIVAASNKDLRALVASGSFREDLFYRIHVFGIDLPALRARREDIPLLVEHFLGHFAQTLGRAAPAVTPQALNAFMGHAWPGNVRELRNAVEHALVVNPDGALTVADLPPEVRASTTGPGAPVSPSPGDLPSYAHPPGPSPVGGPVPTGGPVPPDPDHPVLDSHLPDSVRSFPGRVVPGDSPDPPPTGAAASRVPLGSSRNMLGRGAPRRSPTDEATEVLSALTESHGNRAQAARLLGISRVALWKRIKRLGLADQVPPPRGGLKPS